MHFRPLRAVAFSFAALVPLTLFAGAALADGQLSLSGQRVRIYDLAGKLEVVPGTGTSVTIDYVARGRDAAKLGIKTGNDFGATWLAVDFPGDRIVNPSLSFGSSSDMWVREDGRFGGHETRLNARRVRITGRGPGTEAWADLRIHVPPGQDIEVYLGVGQANVSNVNGKLSVDCASAAVSATGTRGKLSIDTGSGEVHVTGAEGDLSIDTGSGDVVATRVHCERMAVDTGSGSIRIEDASANSLALDTGSGDVECTRVASRQLAVDTGSGSVGLDLTSDIDQLAIDTGSGEVTISAPGTLGATISIETGSGDISSDFPLHITRKDDDSVRGTIGDGHGQIVIETGSGSVRLTRRGT